jgi:hypothetical protein
MRASMGEQVIIVSAKKSQKILLPVELNSLWN